MKEYRVKAGSALKFTSHDADDTGAYPQNDRGKEQAKADAAKLIGRLDALQERLYANGTRSLLIVLQGGVVQGAIARGTGA